MKKFKFPLESVLKVRTLHKKLAEREVSVTQSRLNRTQQELTINREAYSDTFKMLYRKDNNHAFFNELAQRYQQSLEVRHEQLEEEQNRLNDRLEGEKRALTRKMREEMVIDKLKEYQKSEHVRTAERSVQSELEELDILKRGNRS